MGKQYTEQELLEFVRLHLAPNYFRFPVIITRGKGCFVWSKSGKRFLDMLSCYSAVNLGHLHPAITRAVKRQLQRIAVMPNPFPSDKLALFGRDLAEFCAMDMVVLMTGGAETVETSIKIARKWAYTRKGVPKDRAEIIVCDNNFHGRTTTIVGFSSEPQYKDGFGPYGPGFVSIPFGDTQALREAITPHTAALLLEPVQGEGGIIVPPDGYLQECRAVCRESNALFIADEIQTALGRTGYRFACDYEHVKPDLYLLAKSLGGGEIAISAVVGNRELMSVLKPGDHGSTFGGNPLACAAGLAALKVYREVEEELFSKVRELGEYFRQALRNIKSPYVKEVRGRGLMIGTEFNREGPNAHEVCMRLFEKGIICKDTREYVLRFAPPLTISREELDWALERIERVLTE